MPYDFHFSLYTHSLTNGTQLVGFARSLHDEMKICGVRVVIICPWFIDTAILLTATRVILAGIPLTPISRVAGAIVNAATDPNWETSGAAYSIPDDGPVIRIERQELAVGIYKVLNDRVQAGMRYVRLLTFLI
jgi:hypothetical protein